MILRTSPSKARPPVLSFRTPPRRTFHSSKTRSQTQSQSAKGEAAGKGAGSGPAAAESLSLSARLKKLSREYGWAAVGVYFGLSLLDFPFCFLLVRTVGTDKIAEIEHVVVNYAKAVIPENVKEFWRNYKSNLKKVEKESGNASGEEDTEGWGVEEAEERHKRSASLATQLALAYAIHKSFIFVRVPLTAAVTPKVVKIFRSWGWKIGKATPGK
ncbi:peptide alpha-n-acetyltransferase [Grosmannia clavigera kw1407]|uniref:Peptide alpha-n-acetyltransferase n=1 Tax=Grosmannia clavigera (strain kw1407 / UAMH 11150) TaxID=655863 RepID=F0XCM9_GROCL|nr:peptide alpha-n-acetyltransferase [Grosmannia clavigera kw1407]EFX03623.1 peptide alpha-n-acetyltransferase [Grosmannia clavigera kw1407]